MSAAPGLLVEHVVGIRHLSPAGAFHVERLLQRVNPTCVLVEGPHGAEEHLAHLVRPETRPPVALLAFIRTRPVRTLLYPLTSYSPEWAACRWALESRKQLGFMDLPAPVFLALGERARLAEEAAADRLAKEADPNPPDVRPEDDEEALLLARNPLEAVARRAGAADMETWWERTFEHALDEDSYVRAAFALGEGMREVRRDAPAHEAETLLREAYMRRRIRQAIAEGHDPAKIVVVCGAFHAPVLTTGLAPMSDQEEQKLPRLDATITLMPYSYQRLHARSGYGAGNHAPSYYGQLHAELQKGTPERLAARFLSKVARRQRQQGFFRAPAQVIDAVRLAHALAAGADSPVVTLRDLRDAAVTCLGAGDPSQVARALDETETGDSIGKLPPGVSRTALQDDFRAEVVRLKLDKFLSEMEQELVLDVREDHRKKTKEAALLDRNRSVFFARLNTCEIHLGRRVDKPLQSTTSWKELWRVRWSAEMEVRLAELSLQGDSVAGVASLLLSERLAQSHSAGQAATVLQEAAGCDLVDAFEAARQRVQAAAVEDDSLASVAQATAALLEVAHYGGVRAIDPAPLWPLIEQLFLRGALLLPQAVLCDDAAKGAVHTGLLQLADAAAQNASRLPVEALDEALRQVALSDAGNPFLAGAATAILLHRLRLTDEELAHALGQRLSPGEDAGIAAGYFEGLASCYRLTLFSRPLVWQLLSGYVDALDGEGFLRALVPLRRAFSTFEQGEIRKVVSSLGDVWGQSVAQLAQAVEQPVSSEELDALAGLGDLDL